MSENFKYQILKAMFEILLVITDFVTFYVIHFDY